MFIDSTGNIKDITCGFIYPDGSFYGTDDYRQGRLTHEKVLQNYNIKEIPGIIRFCLSFIMLESVRRLRRKHQIEISDEYDVECITESQSKLLREWLSAQKGNITCPTIFSKSYQIKYLESLDDKLLTNIITL